MKCFEAQRATLTHFLCIFFFSCSFVCFSSCFSSISHSCPPAQQRFSIFPLNSAVVGMGMELTMATAIWLRVRWQYYCCVVFSFQLCFLHFKAVCAFPSSTMAIEMISVVNNSVHSQQSTDTVTDVPTKACENFLSVFLLVLPFT